MIRCAGAYVERAVFLRGRRAMTGVKSFVKTRSAKVLSALAVVLSMAAHAHAEAGDWWMFVGAGRGNCESVTGDVGVRRTFSPLYEGETWELTPLAEVSAMLWHHNSDENVWSGGVSVGLLLIVYREGAWRPYASGTVGGFLLSDDEFGTHDMGGRFQFRSKGALGIQFGESFRHSLQLEAAHISNAGIYDRNSGFNTFGVSYGFRF